MALKDQPYIPLYVQDVLTDEKLIECSAKAHGVYFRLLCVLHKQPEYGKFLLKQKYKQTDKQNKNFALALARPLAFDFDTVFDSIEELLREDVIQIEGNFLVQKRMVKDFYLSEIRAKAGSSGGKKTQHKNKNFAKANIKANTEYEIEYEIEYEDINGNINFENFKNLLLEDQIQKEQTCMSLKITPDFYTQKTDIFISESKATEKATWKNYSEFKKHFFYWLKNEVQNGSSKNKNGRVHKGENKKSPLELERERRREKYRGFGDNGSVESKL